MKILLFGATGAAGSRIAAEAHRRGHHVTAASRGHRSTNGITGELAQATVLTLDASARALVAEAAQEHDVVVAATRPAPGRERDVEALTTGVADGARRAGRRLIVVGGAAPCRFRGPRRSRSMIRSGFPRRSGRSPPPASASSRSCAPPAVWTGRTSHPPRTSGPGLAPATTAPPPQPWSSMSTDGPRSRWRISPSR